MPIVHAGEPVSIPVTPSEMPSSSLQPPASELLSRLYSWTVHMNFPCDYTLCSWLCIGLFHAVFLGLTHIVTHFETSFLCLTNTTLYEYYILFSRVSDEHLGCFQLL